MLLSGKFTEKGLSMRPKAQEGDKKNQSLSNRGSVLFCVLTTKLKARWKEASSHVILRTDLIHTKKAKGLLQLILLYSIRTQFLSPLPAFTLCALNHGRTYHLQAAEVNIK